MSNDRSILFEDHHLEEEGFDREFTQHNTLCLLIRRTSLNYAIFDQEKSKFVLQAGRSLGSDEEDLDPVDALRSLSAADELIHRPFKSTIIGLADAAATLIPQSHWKVNEAGLHLGLQHPLKGNELLRADFLDSWQACVEYAIEADLADWLQSNFASAKVIHAHTALMEAFAGMTGSGQEKIFLNIYRRGFTMAAFRQRKLMLLNDYPIRSREDFIYFVSLACHELGFDREQARFVFSGEISEESGIFEVASKYLKHISFAQRPDDFQYQSAIREIPSHFYFNLFTLPLCAL
jgi:hypothetical protein